MSSEAVEINFFVSVVNAISGGYVSRGPAIAKCETLEECFDVLDQLGHKVAPAKLLDINDNELPERKTEPNYNIVYASKSEFLKNAEPYANYYFISGGGVDYANKFHQEHAAWCRKARLRKIFHPGNSLTLGFIFMAVGLGLIALGFTCPPALVFTALSLFVFSSISAGIFAIDWLKRRSNVKYALRQERVTDDSIDNLLGLKAWMNDHRVQTTLMIIGALIFISALVLTVGYFIAPAGIFGFMEMGVGGGAIGLLTNFFTIGLGEGLASLLTGAALILGLVNILDTSRRAISGIYKRVIQRDKVLDETPDNLKSNNIKNKVVETTKNFNKGSKNHSASLEEKETNFMMESVFHRQHNQDQQSDHNSESKLSRLKQRPMYVN